MIRHHVNSRAAMPLRGLLAALLAGCWLCGCAAGPRTGRERTEAERLKLAVDLA